ncbi:hypothetical protein BMW24_015735 [Mycobacterium heckeshornense]|uniref:Uncharacterized protein n=1 Tax=Mycobacterium heckeshornense TaxID=110505 RepID=A0A2G8B631_9MYCO|nr:hypothetical protein BMW24_015735 [Mycobacterium heckeshornense]BCO34971.1 hypothetical protein MHEC_14040 [Mycobacterium heckeshornense]BCQ08139.1 hypothetical protein JMUB5695_01564 [Mycobacterium heckeshornense]
MLDVTLWLFGGVTRLGGPAKTPRKAFLIAISGPATGLTLAGLFACAAVGLDALHVAHIAGSVAWWLAGANLLLGLFSLLPGAPLDGGQVQRAHFGAATVTLSARPWAPRAAARSRSP